MVFGTPRIHDSILLATQILTMQVVRLIGRVLQKAVSFLEEDWCRGTVRSNIQSPPRQLKQNTLLLEAVVHRSCG